MQVLLLSMSAHITKELGMAPGGEFRAAYQEVSNYTKYFTSYHTAYVQMYNLCD